MKLWNFVLSLFFSMTKDIFRMLDKIQIGFVKAAWFHFSLWIYSFHSSDYKRGEQHVNQLHKIKRNCC